MQDVISFVKEKLGNHTLLYLTQFGSHLYGTHSENSDVDYKGLFLPNKKSLLLQQPCKSFNFSTGDDESRNTAEDIDIEVWSLHYYLKTLLKNGETQAIDLLFSINHPVNSNVDSCVVYNDGTLDKIYENRHLMFDPKSCKAFIHYAIQQGKRYGIRGSRLGLIKNVYEYLEQHFDNFENLRLRDIAPYILDNFYNSSYCFSKYLNGDTALVLIGKTHMYSIKLEEFFNRIKREYDKYGDRAKQAEQNSGIDYKALSHAVRATIQMKELLTTWNINFPLNDPNQNIKKIKAGKLDWKNIEELIINGLNEVEELQKETQISGKHDETFVNSLILSQYE